ncbi:MAG: hypothetical protein HYU66_02415 [Armatimonadetes bacterium]|nr:hypothetical protein [Armatimonadota bacterium]
MVGTPHLVAGATLGRVTGRWWLALPLAFLSHFLLDAVPHLDWHRLFGGPHGVTTAEVACGILDFAAGLWLVLWLAGRHPQQRRLIVVSAIGGLLIDLVEYATPIGRFLPAWLRGFHHAAQHNVPLSQWPLGVATQLLVIGAGIWLCLRPDEEPAG